MIGVLDCDLIDRGTRFPNLASMKISGFYRRSGEETTLVLDFETATRCAKIFASKVFTRTRTPEWLDLLRDRCEFGGTGFDLYGAAPLPFEIERCRPDYDLYRPFVESFADGKKPAWLDDYTSTSVGFTSRGRFRRRPFCVNRDKRKVERRSPLSEFYDPARKYVTLLDDNVFACADQWAIFDELEATGKPFVYKQGLDLRLLTPDRAKFLARAKYRGDVIFAFDNIDDAELFRRKAEIYRNFCSKRTKAYLLCGYFKRGVDELRDFFTRLSILAEFRFLPYRR